MLLALLLVGNRLDADASANVTITKHIPFQINSTGPETNIPTADTQIRLSKSTQKQYIKLMTRWDIEPRLYPPGFSTNKADTKLMIFPLGFLLLFLIGLGIKATHWWNEDIRYADGLMVNIYTPISTPRRVLAKTYSTEQGYQSDKTNTPTSHQDIMDQLQSLDMLHGTGSRSFLVGMDDNISIGGAGKGGYKMDAYHSASVHQKRKHLSRNVSVGSGSPTESVCSRCRYIDSVEARLQLSERDICQRYHDHYSNPLKSSSSSLAMRQLQHQISSASSHSTATMKSDSCSEGAPLLIARTARSSDRLHRRGQSRDKPNVRPKLHTDSTDMKTAQRQKKPRPLTRRAVSESLIGVHRMHHKKERAIHTAPVEEVPDITGINALLKNSLNLNLDILHGMSLVGSRWRPVRVAGNRTPECDQPTESSNLASPNQTSRGSSSYVSSSDITSSTPTSARTSVTGLYSSQSSAGSLSAAISRQNSKQLARFLLGKQYIQYENASKTLSTPSLKIGLRHGQNNPKREEEENIVFTIGNDKIEVNRKMDLRRTWSSSNGMDWKKSPDGQTTNLALCRSMSMDTIVGARGQEAPHNAMVVSCDQGPA